MKIEKSTYTIVYNVETDKYDVAIQYQENFNIGYSEWEILSIQDKDGLEVLLSKEDEKELKKNITANIIEFEEGRNN